MFYMYGEKQHIVLQFQVQLADDLLWTCEHYWFILITQKKCMHPKLQFQLYAYTLHHIPILYVTELLTINGKF